MRFRVTEIEPDLFAVTDHDGEVVKDHGTPEYIGDDETEAWNVARELERYYSYLDEEDRLENPDLYDSEQY